MCRSVEKPPQISFEPMLVTKDIARTRVAPVADDVSAQYRDLRVNAGECVVLRGLYGAEKSTLMRMLFGNYAFQKGAIHVRHQGAWVDMRLAGPQEILAVRKYTMGYVSQCLRVLPQVSTLDIVAEPLLSMGEDEDVVHDRAKALLTRLQVPEKLWSLPPATFSGGEQQRINIARAFIADYPVLLLDQPTAVLEAQNAQIVSDMIMEVTARGAAVVSILQDGEIYQRVGTRVFEIAPHAGEQEGNGQTSMGE